MDCKCNKKLSPTPLTRDSVHEPRWNLCPSGDPRYIGDPVIPVILTRISSLYRFALPAHHLPHPLPKKLWPYIRHWQSQIKHNVTIMFLAQHRPAVRRGSGVYDPSILKGPQNVIRLWRYRAICQTAIQTWNSLWKAWYTTLPFDGVSFFTARAAMLPRYTYMY